MRYVVVEPHSDDAFLSVGGHIESWIKRGDQVLIATIVPVLPRSLANSEAYARAVGAEWAGFSYRGGEDCKYETLTHELMQLSKPGDQYILPLGAAPLSQGEANDHTGDHWRIRQRFEGLGRFWYYVDQPYAVIQKNGERLNELLRGMEVVSYLKPGARKYRHAALFTAQAKFFYYNQDKLPQITELLVQKKQGGRG